jgi:hypothetical protein
VGGCGFEEGEEEGFDGEEGEMHGDCEEDERARALVYSLVS